MGHESYTPPGHERPFVSYISPFDPEYLDRQQLARGKYVESNRAFGGDSIPGMAQRQLSEYLRRDDKDMPDLLSEARSFFAEGLGEREVAAHPETQKITGPFVRDLRAPALMLEAFKKGALPDNLFDIIIKHHTEHFKRASERFSEEIPELHARFMKRINELMADPSHALTEEILPSQLLHQRANEVAVVMGDPLELFKRRVAIGGYSHSTNSISIMYDRPMVKTGGITYHQDIHDHEMLHVISGRAVRRISLDAMNAPPLFEAMRIGLGTGDAFEWLNEAITETLAQDLLTGKRHLNHGSYLTYRQVYHALLSRIPEELFLKAYFENSIEGETDIRPQWETLLQYVEKEFGRDILTEIDQSITKHGDIKEGIKMLRDVM